MKRPGGFDGGSEPDPLPEPVRPAPAPAPEQPAPARPGQPAPASAETVPLSDALELAQPQADVREARRRLRDAERSRKQRERGEQRRFTAHLRRRRRYWIVGGSAVAGLALFVAVGVFTPLMAVREVQVVGAEQVDQAALQSAMSRFEGVPLALVSDQEVHRALELFPLIEHYAIERIPPQTLVLRIEERDAAVAIERDGAFALYDPAGVLLGSAAELPPGTPLAAGAVLDTGSPAFTAATRVIRDLPDDLRAGVVGVQATTEDDIVLTLAGGTQVVWGGPDQTQRKAVVLRSMIASLGTPSMIDVSAPDNPVFK